MEKNNTGNGGNGLSPEESRVLSLQNIKNFIGITLGRIASASLGVVTISMYFTYVYTEFLGLHPGIVSLILMTGVLIDGVTDVLMGMIVDRYASDKGKARPWFFRMAIPVGVAMSLVFFCPVNAPTAVKAVYAFVLYNLFCTFLTTVRLPSMTLVSLSSDSPKVQSIMSWCASVGNTFGEVLTGSLLAIILPHVGGDSLSGYRNSLAVFAVMTIILLLACGILCSENAHRSGPEDFSQIPGERPRQERAERKQQVSGAEHVKHAFFAFWYILTNRYWVIMQVAKFFSKFISGLYMGTLVYFCLFILGSADYAKEILAFAGIASTLGVLAALPLLRFMDSLYIVYTGNLIQLCGCITVCLKGSGSFTMLLVGIAILKFGGGLVNAVENGLVARIVTYGEWKHGHRLDGMTFAGSSVALKICSALSSTMCGYLLAMTGYNPGAGTVPEATIKGISFLFLVLPLVCSIITTVTYFFFNLTNKKSLAMITEIKDRGHMHYHSGMDPLGKGPRHGRGRREGQI